MNILFVAFIDEDGGFNAGQNCANVVLYGLNILLPFITPELLKVILNISLQNY